LKTERPLTIDGQAFLIRAWPVDAGWRVAVLDAEGRPASLAYEVSATGGHVAGGGFEAAVEGLMDLAEGEVRTRLLLEVRDDGEP
jgi:hypothetical protein